MFKKDLHPNFWDVLKHRKSGFGRVQIISGWMPISWDVVQNSLNEEPDSNKQQKVTHDDLMSDLFESFTHFMYNLLQETLYKKAPCATRGNVETRLMVLKFR